VAWADQIVVVDSGSADHTVPLARSLGAEVVEQPWLGFSAQRDYALRLPLLRHDWVYFVDADEWISPQLAAEIAARRCSPRRIRPAGKAGETVPSRCWPSRPAFGSPNSPA
jgi:glycosyltransferase involved in cell wall biosynthesis